MICRIGLKEQRLVIAKAEHQHLAKSECGIVRESEMKVSGSDRHDWSARILTSPIGQNFEKVDTISKGASANPQLKPTLPWNPPRGGRS